MNTLQTASDVINAIGGTAATAALTGRKMPAVSNWRKSNRIPSELFLVVSQAIEQRGARVVPSVFGMSEAA